MILLKQGKKLIKVRTFLPQTEVVEKLFLFLKYRKNTFFNKQILKGKIYVPGVCIFKFGY